MCHERIVSQVSGSSCFDIKRVPSMSRITKNDLPLSEWKYQNKSMSGGMPDDFCSTSIVSQSIYTPARPT